jgi:predicted DNA-binding transcriptional regulator AlpA
MHVVRSDDPDRVVTITSEPLLDIEAVCAYFGGSRPINPATLYRGIRKGRYPAPIKIGPGSSRWLWNECEAALQAMIAGRAER